MAHLSRRKSASFAPHKLEQGHGEVSVGRNSPNQAAATPYQFPAKRATGRCRRGELGEEGASLMDTRRHAPLGRVRPRLVPSSSRSRPHAYLGRTGRPLAEIYVSDHADSRQSGRFRWLLSTCLAGGVGALAILVAIAGSMDAQEGARDIFERLRDTPLALRYRPGRRSALGAPQDRQAGDPERSGRDDLLHCRSIKQRRGNRDYLQHKYYVRLVARLAPVSKAQAQTVPTFNPLKLYANSAPLDDGDRADLPQEADVRLIELNGILPNEDGQELDADEVAALVVRAQAAEEASGTSGGELLAERAQRVADAPAPQTTILTKTTFEQEDAARRLRGPGAASLQGAKGRYAGAHSGAARRAVLAGAHDDRCRAPNIRRRASCCPATRFGPLPCRRPPGPAASPCGSACSTTPARTR